MPKSITQAPFLVKDPTMSPSYVDQSRSIFINMRSNHIKSTAYVRDVALKSSKVIKADKKSIEA